VIANPINVSFVRSLKKWFNIVMVDYKDKNVLVLGLGLLDGAIGVVRFLVKQGAHVTVSDQKKKKELASALEKLKGLKVKYVFGKPPVSLLKNIDCVVINPAVDLRSSFVAAIKKKKIPIESEIGIFVQRSKGKIVAITGSKGKSTIARLVYNMVSGARKKVVLGGNIGISLLDSLGDIDEYTYVVLEISSFHLDLLKETMIEFHPFISVLTNIVHDHLDRYDNFAAYSKSKRTIFQYQTRDDYAVVHENLKKKIGTLKAKTRFFSNKLPRFISSEDVQMHGEHNWENIAAAAEVSQVIGVPQKVIRGVVRRFTGLEHRLEFIRYVRGVKFYNDSASTMPTSTTCALESFSRPVILIAGGVNKNLSFSDLGRVVGKGVKAVYLIGKSARDIQESIKKYSGKTEVVLSPSLEKAVQAAAKKSTLGDIVLFSPACASFDMFQNSRERGTIFKKMVDNLIK